MIRGICDLEFISFVHTECVGAGDRPALGDKVTLGVKDGKLSVDADAAQNCQRWSRTELAFHKRSDIKRRESGAFFARIPSQSSGKPILVKLLNGSLSVVLGGNTDSGSRLGGWGSTIFA